MKFFLDTANIKDIKSWVDTGLIDGVTTNPTLISKEKGDPKKTIKEICKLVKNGDVSVEVTEKDPKKVYAQAKKITKIAKNVVVKIPCHPDYFSVIKKLVKEGVRLNITLVFSLAQGLAMCKLGVEYISPFIGRLDDIGSDGMQLVADLRQMIDEYGFVKTEIIAASIRGVQHLQESILLGADIATVPAAILHKAMLHPLTDNGMKKFLDDWKKVGRKTFP
ncbi:fructose-6-phosphate aldolase [bacterium]|nr:fructose-6-phosphate aldolase [bacterium]